VSNETDTRIDELEQRIARLEDFIALYQALSTYGPSVDSMEIDEAVHLWEEDGIYDLGDGIPELDEGRGNLFLRGHNEIRSMLESPLHKDKFVKGGCAHVMSLPLLHIDGDRAVGIGYHRVFAHGEDGTEVARLVASRWEWRRQESGDWKAVRRTHRLLDGRESSRALLRETLQEIKTGSRGDTIPTGTP
jgi:hypothetical protein